MEEKLPEIGEEEEELDWGINLELVNGQRKELNSSPSMPLPGAFIPSRDIYQVPLRGKWGSKTPALAEHRFK